MRRAPLLAVDVRAGRIAYVRILENAVNLFRQRRLDGENGCQDRILAGFFGTNFSKKALLGSFVQNTLYQVF